VDRNFRHHPLFAGVVLAAGVLAAQSGTRKPEPTTSVRVLFGLTDTAPSRWDGSVQLGQGRVTAIQGLRFGAEDSTDYQSSWRAATRQQGNQLLENGVIITAAMPDGKSAPESRWRIQTPKGAFSFTLRDLRWGDPKTFLDGAVSVERVPPTRQLTTSDDDEYSPAIATAPDGTWIAFVRFQHSDRTLEGILTTGRPLDRFDDLARPAGGDQVVVMRRDQSRDIWSSPIPVSEASGAIAGVAIAVDAEKRIWIIWSAMKPDGFHLFARRARPDGAWDPEIRITSGAGPDMKPVAATDAKGRVWIAWQGYRNGNLEILAAVQNGDGFSPEARISFSSANDWDPAIASSPNGDVAVTWDTYDKGDYDVYARRLRAAADLTPVSEVNMDAPIAIAATPDFEARSSAAYDPHGRLWIAYEISSPRWGGSFGLDDASGSPLYEYRDIRVKCLDGSTLETTAEDLINVMPGAPGPVRRRAARPGANPFEPAPSRAQNRRPGQAIAPRNGPVNSAPRLLVDPTGGVYLAFRSILSPAASRSPAGSIWVEHIAYFDGHEWIGPIFIPRSDGPLESSPALLAAAPGQVIVVTAMDHRQTIPTGLSADRINGDLYLADFQPGIDAALTPEMVKLDPPTPKPPQAQTDFATSVRDYRIQIGAEPPLRILRGDFDRFTDFSPDGTRDGSLEDAYRYLIDAASLDWAACCDNANASTHEYFWWLEQKAADLYRLGDAFTPLFGYDRTARYPEGRREILFARRGIRPLPHLPPVAADSPAAPAPDTRMLYRYLRAFGGISVPVSPTTDAGTDWRDSDREAEPAAAIYEGQRQSCEREGAPRAASASDAISGFHPAGLLSEALAKGYRLGFAAASGHYSTHIAFTSVLASANTREAILDAFRKRRIYASTANIVADVRSGDHLMGDEFEGPPSLSIRLIGAVAFSKITIVKDGKDVSTMQPNARDVKLEWTDSAAQPGKTASYYIRGEESDGNLVWTSPMWITPK
jgi:hypothetical protein